MGTKPDLAHVLDLQLFETHLATRLCMDRCKETREVWLSPDLGTDDWNRVIHKPPRGRWDRPSQEQSQRLWLGWWKSYRCRENSHPLRHPFFLTIAEPLLWVRYWSSWRYGWTRLSLCLRVKLGKFQERNVPSVVYSPFLNGKKGNMKHQASTEKSSVGFEGASYQNVSSSEMILQFSSSLFSSFTLTLSFLSTILPMCMCMHTDTSKNES